MKGGFRRVGILGAVLAAASGFAGKLNLGKVGSLGDIANVTGLSRSYRQQHSRNGRGKSNAASMKRASIKARNKKKNPRSCR